VGLNCKTPLFLSEYFSMTEAISLVNIVVVFGAECFDSMPGATTDSLFA
jgi:hypothetical protein